MYVTCVSQIQMRFGKFRVSCKRSGLRLKGCMSHIFTEGSKLVMGERVI
jgi:hypothetical protein